MADYEKPMGDMPELLLAVKEIRDAVRSAKSEYEGDDELTGEAASEFVRCGGCGGCRNCGGCGGCGGCSGCGGFGRCFRCEGCFRCFRCEGCFRCFRCEGCR
jgi:hypothetical protein